MTMTLEQLVAIEGYADEHGDVTDQMLTLLIDFANAHLSNPPEIPDSSAQPRPVSQGGCNNCGGLGYRSEANGEQISCDLCETSPSDAEIEELGEYIARHLGDKHWRTYEAMREALAMQPVAQGEAVAWQFRNVLQGQESAWRDTNQKFAEDPKHDDDPTIEIRRLYATTPTIPTACACGAECRDTGHGNCRYAPTTIPTGHRVVPVEPTDEMADILTSKLFENFMEYQHAIMNHHTSKPFWKKVIKAMLSAAPDAGGV